MKICKHTLVDICNDIKTSFSKKTFYRHLFTVHFLTVVEFKCIYRVVPFIVNIFLKTLHFVMKLSEFLVCYLLTSYLWMLFFNLFQNFDYFQPKKDKSVNALWFFCQFLSSPNEFGSVFLKESPQEKLQIKNIKKPKFGAAEKIVFFVLFILYWKIQ